jgi:hypothetical protein
LFILNTQGQKIGKNLKVKIANTTRIFFAKKKKKETATDGLTIYLSYFYSIENVSIYSEQNII